jgi:glycolate oxidase iron-sulfur subunit
VRTAFTPEQLADPQLRAAEDSLRRCVHCGFCTATCPTYVLLGDERDSPRGRIALIQNMLESGAAPNTETVRHIDRCLSCLGCRTACPSGVDYAALVDRAREHIHKTFKRPFTERAFRSFVLTVLMHPGLYKVLTVLGRSLATVASSLPGRLGKMGRKIPQAHTLDAEHKTVVDAGAGAARVALLPGCVQRALSPEIDAATRRVLARSKLNAEPINHSGCCGALAFHMGDTRLAKKYARKLIEAVENDGANSPFAAVTMTATGCTAFLKKYQALFEGDAIWEPRAKAFVEKIRDFVELIEPSAEPTHAIAMGDMRVAYHPPCSLQHAQRIEGKGEALLAAAGFKLTSFADTHLCCGSAGSYSILQPEISEALRARKVTAIKDSGATLIASGNIGCITHLSGAHAPPAVHIAELLDWADGGPKPAAIKDD